MINFLPVNGTRFWWQTTPWPCQIFLVLACGLSACAPDTVTVQTHPTFTPAAIKTIGVVPFTAIKGSPGVYQSLGELAAPDVESPEIRSSFSELEGPVPSRPHASKVSVPAGAEKKITDMVYANLKLRPGLKTISPELVSQTLNRMGLDPSTAKASELAKELGKALSLDAVIVGRVRVYRERAGSKFAAIPAAVGFDVQLINAQDGTVIWIGDYFEEQKPLSEDFAGMLERGGRWVTAEELARSGVKRVLQRLPLGRL